MSLTAQLGFSQLIDEVAAITGRTSAARKGHIAAYANATMRECIVQAFFFRDLIEDQITVTAENPFTWERPNLFRRLRTVQYEASGEYPPLKLPGKIQRGLTCYYYAAGTYLAFKGIAINDLLNVAYYSYPKRLKYYDGSTGNEYPAIWNFETEAWSYWNGTVYATSLDTPELEAAAEALVSNWLLLAWNDVVLEGTAAKQWGKVNDDRARSSFALYNVLKADMKETELDESGDH